jgi:hypothetical protein
LPALFLFLLQLVTIFLIILTNVDFKLLLVNAHSTHRIQLSGTILCNGEPYGLGGTGWPARLFVNVNHYAVR